MLLRIKTYFALGVTNLIRVALYRGGLKLGLGGKKGHVDEFLKGDFFATLTDPVDTVANRQWCDERYFFGRAYASEDSSVPPDWHSNCLSGAVVSDKHSPWWLIGDFDLGVGDIKTVWESSRFDWVISFSQAAAGGDDNMLSRLNRWLNDWMEKNPPYLGVNWKCGQEASIRVMHLSVAALILKQEKHPAEVLRRFIKVHLERVEPTLLYAIAQDNNHGTSEAAALYIGGLWLLNSTDSRPQERSQAMRWYKKGRRLLENRARRLIEADGSFSQYSVNYHRLMLDTYSLVEVWRWIFGDSPFSGLFAERLGSATRWLYEFTDESTGDVPNIGANDGARILPLTETDYRDYRPSVQLACSLFLNQRAYSSRGNWDLPSQWLRLGDREIDDVGQALKYSEGVSSFAHGGFAIVRSGASRAFIRFPNFRFRPSQSDLLHLDLWHKGQNLLRDGGTYSYNTDEHLVAYFSGVRSHNTIEFDDRDQMPRFGRFLFGAWPTSSAVVHDELRNSFSVAYSDWLGAHHRRTVSLANNILRVEDDISGHFHKAVLRWRLIEDDWELNGQTLRSTSGRKLTLSGSAAIDRFELVKGRESKYYFDKQVVPVLEVEVKDCCKLITEFILD